MEPQADIVRWLGAYADEHPEVRVGGAGTVILDARNEPEPDAVLVRRGEAGGQSRISSEGYIVGAPELVVEVSASSVSYDLGAKLQAYQRNGVREYIVWQTFDQVITWFSLEDGVFRPMLPDQRGLVHSKVFPGLRLHAEGMLAGDMPRVLAEQRSAIDKTPPE
jgi:Uma2 family endonuclease